MDTATPLLSAARVLAHVPRDRWLYVPPVPNEDEASSSSSNASSSLPYSESSPIKGLHTVLKLTVSQCWELLRTLNVVVYQKQQQHGTNGGKKKKKTKKVETVTDSPWRAAFDDMDGKKGLPWGRSELVQWGEGEERRKGTKHVCFWSRSSSSTSSKRDNNKKIENWHTPRAALEGEIVYPKWSPVRGQARDANAFVRLLDATKKKKKKTTKKKTTVVKKEEQEEETDYEEDGMLEEEDLLASATEGGENDEEEDEEEEEKVRYVNADGFTREELEAAAAAFTDVQEEDFDDKYPVLAKIKDVFDLGNDEFFEELREEILLLWWHRQVKKKCDRNTLTFRNSVRKTITFINVPTPTSKRATIPSNKLRKHGTVPHLCAVVGNGREDDGAELIYRELVSRYPGLARRHADVVGSLPPAQLVGRVARGVVVVANKSSNDAQSPMTPQQQAESMMMMAEDEEDGGGVKSSAMVIAPPKRGRPRKRKRPGMGEDGLPRIHKNMTLKELKEEALARVGKVPSNNNNAPQDGTGTQQEGSSGGLANPITVTTASMTKSEWLNHLTEGSIQLTQTEAWRSILKFRDQITEQIAEHNRENPPNSGSNNNESSSKSPTTANNKSKIPSSDGRRVKPNSHRGIKRRENEIKNQREKHTYDCPSNVHGCKLALSDDLVYHGKIRTETALVDGNVCKKYGDGNEWYHSDIPCYTCERCDFDICKGCYDWMVNLEEEEKANEEKKTELGGYDTNDIVDADGGIKSEEEDNREEEGSGGGGVELTSMDE